MKIEKILLYQNYAIFLQVAKKLWKQNISLYYCTISYDFQKQE